MKFFSGFCFSKEEELFCSLTPSFYLPYTLNGFSYGAILAFEQAIFQIKQHQRIQTLNLFSPAFFQDQKESFKKAQILGFKKNPQNYIQTFLSLCGNPSKQYFKLGTLEELQTLLFYHWEEEKLQFLQESGVKINVFLGEKDKIISPFNVLHFFAPYGVVYFYKNLNHCLQCDHL